MIKDLVGERFGSLAVIGRAGSNARREAVWFAECSCGTKIKVTGRVLRAKGRIDCGTCGIKDTVDHDWTVLSIDGMSERIERACLDVERRFYQVIDFNDLEQEAQILLASNPVKVREYLADPEQGWSHVSRWLWSRLANLAVAEAAIQSQQIDYERLRDE